jgi:hypothetical protein
MILYNSVTLNAAADAMWKWEQTGRRAEALREEATKLVAEYCAASSIPGWVGGLLLDTMQLTVRICNGFPPNDGVVHYDDEDAAE